MGMLCRIDNTGSDEMNNDKIVDLTKGNIYKSMFFYFLPILAGTFFQQLYNTVDVIVVGRFVGKNALGCVGGTSATILQLVLGFFIGLSSGAAVLVSQGKGAGDDDMVRTSVHGIYFISIAGSVIVMLLSVWLCPFLLRVMGTPEELIAGSILYLRVYFTGTLFIFIFNAGSAALRALGDSRHPLYYLIVCSVINIVLDFLLVAVFKMGVVGAALATVIAQAVSAILTTRLLIRTVDLRLHDMLRPDMGMLKRELRIGIPYGLEWSMYNVPNMIVQTGINSYGTDTLAAWAAYWKIDGVFWMICGAIGMTVTTFSGQNFGAGNISRVRSGVRTIAVGVIALTLVYSFFVIRISAPLMRIFVTDDDVIRIGVYMITVMMPWYFLYIPIELLSAALRGLGDVLVPLIITVFGVCFVRISWVLVSEKLFHDLRLMLLNYPATWFLTGLMFIIYYRYRMKRKADAKKCP